MAASVAVLQHEMERLEEKLKDYAVLSNAGREVSYHDIHRIDQLVTAARRSIMVMQRRQFNIDTLRMIEKLQDVMKGIR